MKIVCTDVLVVGGGLAGLRTAIAVKRRGQEVIVLSLCPPKRSHSAAAQGGMQASLGNVAKGAGDNEDIHFEDTVKGSDWGADQQVVRMFVYTAPKAVRELAAWGVPWNRVHCGPNHYVINGENVTINEADQAHGLIAARNFGGTKKWRTAYVSDGTGHSMLYTMSNQSVAENIEVHERTEAISLICEEDRCVGAVVRDLTNGQLTAYIAKATCIATGGFGRIYRNTTNAVINEGIGTAIALETGRARLANMEAIQFHPTAIFPAGILVTEGCRGDGGLLLDKDLHRFMPDYEPDKKELASRDVVSRCMELHIAKGKGVKTRFGEHLWLDIRLLGEEHINSKLREVKEICINFLGIDPAKELIPVRPAQHYSMGGIRTNYQGQAMGLTGLFAVGEAACWDLHGFNRLGGNSVAETVVAGMLIGEYIADYIQSTGHKHRVSMAVVESELSKQKSKLQAFFNNEHTENPFTILKEMQNVMSSGVAIFRNEKSLKDAIDALQKLTVRAKQIYVHGTLDSANPELVAAYRVRKMLKLCLCVAYSALARTESRGAHYRDDYPLRNDKDWLSRTLSSWPYDDSSAPTLSYETIDINNMELVPGWRGYGDDKRIEHPDTAAREAKVIAVSNSDLSANQKQLTLNPFMQNLPSIYQVDNQRIADLLEGTKDV